MPVAAGLIIGGPLSARLAQRIGTKLVVAGGLVLVARAGSRSSRSPRSAPPTASWRRSLSVFGMGLGLAMAPATDSIMGALPVAKASVGSAVNDATRTTGGALGVAVLGSLLSSHYRGAMESVTHALPGAAADAARDSLAGALVVGGRIGGQAGARLTETAQSAFVGGMHTAVLVAAGIALAGALIALVALPAREADTEPAPAPAAAPEAVVA